MNEVAIFCASSTQVDDVFLNDAKELAKCLVEANYGIRYGGGAVGLMGVLANTALSLNGSVIGVIPRFMVEVEWQHPEVETMHIVETMHQRKAALLDNCKAVIALPGGTGTLDELIDVMSLKKLGLFMQPIIIVNVNGFYDLLISFFDKMVEEKMIRLEHLQLYQVVNSSSEVVEAINNSPIWHVNAITLAAV